VQFYTQIENGVHSTFDGAAFSAPIIEFLRCIVGNKVFALEKGLAWLKENLNLRLPRVLPNVLKLSAANITELAIDPCKCSGVWQFAPLLRRAGSYHGKGIRVLSYRTVLRGEMYMPSTFLGAYVFVVLTTIILLIIKSRRNRCIPPLG